MLSIGFVNVLLYLFQRIYRPPIGEEDMDIDGIAYIAEAISNLANIPVHVYAEDELYYLFTNVSFEADPIVTYQEQIDALPKGVSYFVTSESSYYGVVSSEHVRLVVGPFWDVWPSNLTLQRMAAKLAVNPERLNQFIDEIRSISLLPLYTALKVLCMMNYVINANYLVLSDIIIHGQDQETITRELAEEDFSRREFRNPSATDHSSEQVEATITELVRSGKPDELESYLKSAPSFKQGAMSPNRVRSEKNAFVVSATLVSRAAAAGGMSMDEALTKSDVYINRCELLSSIDDIHELSFHMVIDYAESVMRLRITDSPSKTVLVVTAYVHAHLYGPITTEEIARSLYMSRSVLSTAFKRETGQNLSDFVQKEKVEEAKGLLRNTEQTLLSISTYLGYSSQSHFNTVFKRYTGVTPREYRRSSGTTLPSFGR